ncbi:hypothetical protein HGRIS_005915 [Hohenbuehelia grisea]|uniref:Dynamin-type G domain-containing protein n=1 Tax=Hohenbuehelia grisea TaxID=104357 RepID=A0ABR3JZE4_9AGAR
MAQAYFPMPRVSSPVEEEQSESAFGLAGGKHLRPEDVQEAYIEQKDRLVNAIDATKSILGDIRSFNKDEWVVRYPQLREQPVQAEATTTETSDAAPPSPKRRRSLRRSMTFADDPTSETEVVLSPGHQGKPRSLTLASLAEVKEDEDSTSMLEKENEASRLLPSDEFQVLRLDLKLGTHGSSTSPATLVNQLEKSSIANLLDDRIGASVAHVDKLRLRVEDTSSKVLVTGDLNAGKSTFVNALLRREVMPVDQQPCTTAFCEVHDAAENDNVEEVHVLKDGVNYDIKDDASFERRSLDDLDDIVTDNESAQPMLKLYLADTRAPSESLLNNGVVDISLIDAPGLNRDSLKTTALFARQEEIDVVVFVVSAENHFTLSSKEFLWSASNEKAYVFIVVNKYDQIKNKEKCQRLVLDQIKQLSPRTYEDADDLVHFVDSAAALKPYANPAFDDLETALRSFVLVKRSKSKLHPVSTYLHNLLSDVELLTSANAIVAQSEIDRAEADLARARPVLEKMKNGRDDLEDGLEVVEEQNAQKASTTTTSLLTEALDRVGQGKLGVDNAVIQLPTYPGLLGVWDYARDVRKAMLASLDAAVKLAEDEARVMTSTGVETIKALGDKHLPEGAERSRRVFMPEAMFSARSRNARRRSAHGCNAIVAGGVHGLGIGLAQRSDLLDTTFFDLFDVHHQFWVHFGDEKADSKKAEDESAIPSALSVVSVGAGALTMVGGQAVGARGLIEGILRLSDLFQNETARKWAAPVLGAAVVGLTAYVILELPSTIPRTVGRRVRSAVMHGERDEEKFVAVHAGRVSRETRKVLRLASWDLRERFRTALEERGREVKGAEEMERRARRAKEWFGEVVTRTVEARGLATMGEEF